MIRPLHWGKPRPYRNILLFHTLIYDQASTLRHTSVISQYSAITYFDIWSGLHTEAHLGQIVHTLIYNQAFTLRHTLAISYILWYTTKPSHWGTPWSHRTYFDIQPSLQIEAHLGHIVHTLIYVQASRLRHTLAISYILWYTFRPPDWGTPWPYRTYFDIRSGLQTEAHLGHIVHTLIYNQASTLRHNSAIPYTFWYTIRPPHWTHLGHILHILIYNQASTLRHTSTISYILWYTIRPPHWGAPRPYRTYFDIQSGLHTEGHLGHIVHTLIYNQASRFRHTLVISYTFWYTIRPPHLGTPWPYRTYFDIRSSLQTEAHLGHILHTLIYNQASTLRHTSAKSYILW